MLALERGGWRGRAVGCILCVWEGGGDGPVCMQGGGVCAYACCDVCVCVLFVVCAELVRTVSRFPLWQRNSILILLTHLAF